MKFIRMPEVESITGLTRSAIYQKILDGEFPKQYKIGKRAVAWLQNDVYDWMNGQMA